MAQTQAPKQLVSSELSSFPLSCMCAHTHTHTHTHNSITHAAEQLRIKWVQIAQANGWNYRLRLAGTMPRHSNFISLPTNSYLLFKEKRHFDFSSPGRRFFHVNSSQPFRSRNEEQLILVLSNAWLSIVLLWVNSMSGEEVSFKRISVRLLSAALCCL